MTPLLKKDRLDCDELFNFRAISNVPLLTKMLKRIFGSRLNAHLDIVGILPYIQSAYRRNFSMETTLTRVMFDLMIAADVVDVSVLALLDLSAAFDTVGHFVLLQRLTVLTTSEVRYSYGLKAIYR